MFLNYFAVFISILFLSLPFFFLAYSIFLLKENQTSKYRNIYKRVIIYTLPSLFFIHVIFFAPPINDRINKAYKEAEQGYFISTDNKDTLSLYNSTITMKYGDSPRNNFSSSYLLYPVGKTDKWNLLKEGLGSYFNGSKIELKNYELAILYPLYFPSDEVEKAKFERTNRKRHKFYTPPKRDICMEYTINITKEDLVLIPVNHAGKPAYFKREQSYYGR